MKENQDTRVAVLGSGAGGCAAAYDFARLGHSVSLFDFADRYEVIAAVREAGGISATGEIQGFASPTYAIGPPVQVAGVGQIALHLFRALPRRIPRIV